MDGDICLYLLSGILLQSYIITEKSYRHIICIKLFKLILLHHKYVINIVMIIFLLLITTQVVYNGAVIEFTCPVSIYHLLIWICNQKVI